MSGRRKQQSYQEPRACRRRGVAGPRRRNSHTQRPEPLRQVCRRPMGGAHRDDQKCVRDDQISPKVCPPRPVQARPREHEAGV
eukprot:scaffold104948_cov29-Tisochrysis_lutea.AAC.4